MSVRRGFTLLELLVVMSVIAVLAGLLVPIVGMVRKMANDYKCGNNLQQIAAAIEAYKGENDDAFPSHMIGGVGTTDLSTNDLVHSGGPLKGLIKIFRCPFDPNGGTDPFMGRAPFMGDLSGLYDSGSVNGTLVGSSYDYETSGNILGDTNAGQVSWFYNSVDIASMSTAGVTWAEGKHNQLTNGSPSGNTYTGPFSGTALPIIRCYWHHKWTRQNAREARKVKNVAWDLNVFPSIPYWEHEANPSIPLPTN